MRDLKKIFSSNIKRLRKNRNLSQEQFAELVNMEWRSIQNLESGRNLARSQNLQKICDNLNIPPTELFLSEESDNIFEKISQINTILNGMDEENIDIIYRIINALNNRLKTK